jgi:hypothetical protein
MRYEKRCGSQRHFRGSGKRVYNPLLGYRSKNQNRKQSFRLFTDREIIMSKTAYGIRKCETCSDNPEFALFDTGWSCPSACLRENNRRKRQLREHERKLGK